MTLGFMVNDLSVVAHGLMLLASLSAFEDVQIKIAVPQEEKAIIDKLHKSIKDAAVSIVPFRMPVVFKKFPFADKVFAAAHIESLVEGKLLWVDVDSLFFKSPNKLIEGQSFSLGCRPVDMQLIGNDFEEELSPFWKEIYTYFNVILGEEWVRTAVDEKKIRPYYNAGFLLVDPCVKVLSQWQKAFSTLALKPELLALYQMNPLYKVFLHQGVLTGVVMSQTNKIHIHLFDERVNYPIHLHHDHCMQLKINSSNDLFSCRYDTYFNRPIDEQKFIFEGLIAKVIQQHQNKLGLEWVYEV